MSRSFSSIHQTVRVLDAAYYFILKESRLKRGIQTWNIYRLQFSLRLDKALFLFDTHGLQFI